MKKVGQFLLTVVLVGGYAGCGGDGDGFPEECEVFCQTVCDKAFVCTNSPKIEDQVQECLDLCQDTVEEEGYDASGVCADANSYVSALSCNDIFDISGIRSTTPDFGRLIERSIIN
jgi:hypothetical protein